ncbi:MAG: MaoC/PaaZ C-terminal domain-containing protein [Pseudomonadota bacterium]
MPNDIIHDARIGEVLRGVPYDAISVGDSAEMTKTLHEQDIALFATMSGDVNPQHMDAEWSSENTRFGGVIAHGLWTGALISTVLGTKLPGPGTIFVRFEVKFRRPVLLGDTVTSRVEATAKSDEKRLVTFDCRVFNQNGDIVIGGEADVIAPKAALDAPTKPAPRFERIG